MLFLTVNHFLKGGVYSNLWPAIGDSLMVVQTLAGMEVRERTWALQFAFLSPHHMGVDSPRCARPR